MKTYLECIPCFLNQALRVMNLNGVGHRTKEKVIKKIITKLAKLNLNSSPPEFALYIYKIIEDTTGNNNLYENIKRSDNFFVIDIIPDVKKIIKKSMDPLKTLIKIAISGNIMDFAANPKYDVLKTVKKSINSKFAINEYKQLKKEILNAKSIAYFVDNAGEVIFDRLLIEEILKVSNAQITIFVRSRPIINDITEEDAKVIGLDKISNVKIKKIRTIFPFINNKSKGFKNSLKKYDIVISKGQANYECLSEFKGNIYFLLIAKCEVIARNIGVKKGSFILMGGKKNGK